MKSAPEVHSNTVPTACGLLSQPRSEPPPYSAGDTTKKELFAGNKSFGKSRALHFAPYLFRASAGYSFSVRHHLEMTVYASSRTPDGDDLFLNLEYNNRPVEDPTEEKRYGG